MGEVANSAYIGEWMHSNNLQEVIYMEANIYKVNMKLKTSRNFLIKEGFTPVGESKHTIFKRKIEEEEIEKRITSQFYFKSELELSKPIHWLEDWKSFFDIDISGVSKYNLNSGCILISLDDTRYIISFGRAHHVILKEADDSFGFDVAERILDSSKIKMKNSVFFNNMKSRTYTQFRGDSFLTSEIGESNNQIVGNISIVFSDFLLYHFNESIKFGSSVKLESNELTNQDILNIVAELHFIQKKVKVNVPLPKVEVIAGNSALEQKLDLKLNQELLNKEASNISLHQLIEVGGDWKHPFSDCEIKLICNKPFNVDGYNIEYIKKVLIDNDITNLNKVKIRNETTQETYKLTQLLDYSVVLNGITYTLMNGKWAKFNQTFIKELEREIRYVNKVTTFNDSYELNGNVLEQGRKEMTEKDEYDNVEYEEYPYNIYLKDKFDLVFLDRKTEHKKFKEIEFADLYCPTEKKLTHVKIGGTSDFRYCITQSQNSARIYNTDNTILSVYKIEEVEQIEMLLVTKLKYILDGTDNIDFNKSKSINFKLELVTWFKYIRELNYEPKIMVARLNR